MRTTIQRVSKASVTVKDKTTAHINSGLLVLVGFESEDKPEDLAWMSSKIVNLRIFPDEHNVMNLSVKESKGDIIVVSQFTLHASTKKGNRPSYIRAAGPDIAIPLYNDFIKKVEDDLGKKVGAGVFGAHMIVELTNDGPITINIDSKNKQ